MAKSKEEEDDQFQSLFLTLSQKVSNAEEVLSYSPLYQLFNFFQPQERMIGRCFHIPEDALFENFTMFPCTTDHQ